jgi:hypothetical protein
MEDFFADRPKHSIFTKIRLWWKFHARYYHKDFVRGIQKLWYWFPIIWKDRDWDQHYIYTILKHKLQAQANYISKNDRHTRSQQDARNMRICVSLIEKCQDEIYAMEYMDYGKDRVWFTPCEDRPGLSQYNSQITEDNYSQFIKKYPLIYKRVMKGEGPFTLDGRDEDEINKIVAMNIAHTNQHRARKLLFKIMESEIEGWWD